MEIVGRGGSGERLDSQILRDFLRIREDDHLHQNNNNVNQITSSSSGGDSSGLTLHAVLSDKRAPPLQRVQSNRTLQDIIREDQTSGGTRDGRKSWRQLRDRIRLRRRSGGAWPSAVPIPISDDFPPSSSRTTVAATRRSSSRLNSGESNQSVVSTAPVESRSSGRFDLASSSLPRRQMIDNFEEEERGAAVAEQPVRMSLMALLAETDRQLGFGGSAYLMYDEEAAEEEETTTAGGGDYNNCCVCMVRHKGAAFIPCGHTFCRLCSRELWVQRRNCPLCNNYIKEILDIF